MVWFSLTSGVVAIAVILALAFDRSRLAKELGSADEEITQLKAREIWLRRALAARSSPDPDLADLGSMFSEDVDSAS